MALDELSIWHGVLFELSLDGLEGRKERRLVIGLALFLRQVDGRRRLLGLGVVRLRPAERVVERRAGAGGPVVRPHSARIGATGERARQLYLWSAS